MWFGKYKILKILGTGGSAKVFLARHIKLGTLRAIKCLNKKSQFYEQLLNEAQILKNLKHNNIPSIYDIEEDSGYSYIIEEYIEGESLNNYKSENIVIPESEIIRIAEQICELIIYLHSFCPPILYLDLKPENIIMCNNCIKLIDFGTAVYEKDVLHRKYSLGTVGYAAPEQFKSTKLDERADIYSIGMILFFLMTGTKFDNSKLTMGNIDDNKIYTNSLKRIINKCLKYNSFQRYSSVVQLLNQIYSLKKRKKDTKKEEHLSKSLIISIAGSQSRSGTTHIGICFCSYLKQMAGKCLYVEKNDSNTVKAILRKHGYREVSREAVTICGISFLPSVIKTDDNLTLTEQYEIDFSDFPFIIFDFGMLTEENKDNFLEADIKLLVLGSKVWELPYSEEALEQLSWHEELCCLFNFTDGKQYRELVRRSIHQCNYRFPYISDPFESRTNYVLKELIHEILNNYLSTPKNRLCQKVYELFKSVFQ